MMPDDPMQSPYMIGMEVSDQEDGSICAHFDEAPGTHLRAANVQHAMRYLAKATQIIARIVVDKGNAALADGTFDRGGELKQSDLEARGISTQEIDGLLVTYVEGIHYAVLTCADEATYIAAFRILLNVALRWVDAVQKGLQEGGLQPDDAASAQHSASSSSGKGEDKVLRLPVSKHAPHVKTND